MKNKFRVASMLALAFGAVLLNFAPKVFAGFSQDRLTVGDKQTFEVQDTGVANSSSGYKSELPIFGFHESFINLRPSSVTYLFSPPQILITTTAVPGTGALANAVFISTSLQAGFIPIGYPRTLQISAHGAGGFVTILGTNAFNQAATETIAISSSAVLNFTKTAWLSVSSFTITVTTVSVDRTTATFDVALGTGVGLANKVSFSSDSYRVVESGLALSSFTLDINNYTVNLASQSANGAYLNMNRDVLYQSRKSIFGD